MVSQQKFFVNDADGSQKFLATTKEKDILALNFGSCKNPSSPPPCSAQLEWKDFYEGVELPGGAYVLTEKSTAICTAKGGQITIKTHGQQIGVTTQQLELANKNNWSAVNSLAAEADVTILQEDQDEQDQPGIGVKKIAPQTGKSLHPVGSCVDFKVTEFYKGNATTKKGINWVIYDSKAKLLVEHTDIGATMSATFRKPGEYIIEAYGNSRKGDTDIKKATTCRITIKHNELASVQESKKQTIIRVTTPTTFTLQPLFPGNVPFAGGDLSLTTWQLAQVDKKGALQGKSETVIDAQGSEVKGQTLTHTFASEGSYLVMATLNGITRQSPRITVTSNKVTQVQVNKSLCRPEQEVTFTIQDQFEINPPTEQEISLVSWICAKEPIRKDANGKIIADYKQTGGLTFTRAFSETGKYKVYAFRKSASEQVCSSLEVTEPTLTHACWKAGDGTIKHITGWNEKASISLTFKVCGGLKIDIEIYALKANKNKVLLTTIPNCAIVDNKTDSTYVSLDFILDKNRYEHKLHDGDQLFFVIKNPSYTIQNELSKSNYLKFTTKEKITKIAFYKDNKQIIGTNYGDALKGRVYAYNMVGKSVIVDLYRIRDYTQLSTLLGAKDYHSYIKTQIGSSGYAEFDLSLKEAENGTYGETIHYFHAIARDSASKPLHEQGSLGEIEHKVPLLDMLSMKGVMLFAMKDSKKGEYPPVWAGIEKITKPEKNGKCEELIWGKKVSCAFRNKVIQISKRLGCDPNNLMAAMALETGGTFNPSIRNSRGYVGLIQIGVDAAKTLGTTTDALRKMSAVHQLDYVEKYLNHYKGKLNTLTDFYLAILMPVDVGKGNDPNHVVFDNEYPLEYNTNGKVTNLSYARKYGYKANAGFLLEEGEKEKRKEDYTGPGKTYVWEIAKSIKQWHDKGKLNVNKVCDGTCPNNKSDGNWHEPVENPQITVYMQSGDKWPKYAAFGYTRKETRDSGVHQGLDLFATVGTPIYACLNADVVYARDTQSGYGKMIVLKINDNEAFKKRKRGYILKYTAEGEEKQGEEFNESGDMFLRYGHLDSISVKVGDSVTAGKQIGTTGTSGVPGGTCGPHLHFEIASKENPGGGLTNRCNPGFYVYYKNEDEMSLEESNYQNETKDKGKQ